MPNILGESLEMKAIAYSESAAPRSMHSRTGAPGEMSFSKIGRLLAALGAGADLADGKLAPPDARRVAPGGP